MHRRLLVLLVVAIAAFLLIGLSLIISVHVAQAHPMLSLSRNSSGGSPTPTPTPPQNGFFNWEDPSFQGAILGAIIGGFFTIISIILNLWQNRHIHQLQEKLNREMMRNQHAHDQEMRRLETEAKAKEKEEENKQKEEQAVRSRMQRANSLEERALVYRAALRAPSHISSIQILGMMGQPFKVEDIYVPVRVHSIDKLNVEVDMTLRDVEDQHDPDALMGIELERLKKRFSSAVEPAEAIRFYSRCVIVGDPGAGKTTLLKYMLLNAAGNRLMGLPNLPIYIALNAFAVSKYGDLLDFAAVQCDEEYGFPKDDARMYMEEKLNNGSALLLLDGLDEALIGDSSEEAEKSYNRVATAIRKVSSRYPQAPVVVTARRAGYQQRSALVGFTQLEVLGFRPEDIAQFVNNWFGFDQKQQRLLKAIDFNKKLERHPRIHTLAANPLLLSLIVLVYEARGELPDSRAELYRQCVETLLFRWDTTRDIRRLQEFKSEKKEVLLTEIAWHFHTNRQRYFPESELLQVIGEFLPAISLPAEGNGRVLAEIATQNGLIKPQAWKWYGFLHLALQEYFVARYIDDHNEPDTLLGHLGDPWWEEVVLLYAGRKTSDISALLQKLLSQDSEGRPREDIFQTNLILAGRCLIERPTVRQTFLRQEVISRLFTLLKSTIYSLTREQCIGVLTAMSETSVTEQLLQLLADEAMDQHMRWRIAETIGATGERSAAPKLVLLLSDKNIDLSVREAIAEALGTLGNRLIASDLLNMLNDQLLEVSIRRDIAKSLGILGERSIAHDLVTCLNMKIDVNVGCSIADALGMLNEKACIPDLLALLANTQVNWRVRCSIADALGTMSQKSHVHDLLKLLFIEENDRNVRYHIADAVGRLGERSIVPQLRNLLFNEQVDLQVRKSIKIALARLGDQSVIPDLVNLLTGPDPDTNQYVRRSIVDILAMFGNQSIIPQLLPLLSNPYVDLYVRRGIVSALIKLGGRSLSPKLLELLANERIDPNVRRSIAYALGTLGEVDVAPRMVGLLTTEQDQHVCQGIVEALGTLGDRSAVYSLRNLLANGQIDPLVRQSIASALGRIANDHETVEALYALLYTTDIVDAVHRALWSVSRRAGVRVFSDHGSKVKSLELSTGE